MTKYKAHLAHQNGERTIDRATETVRTALWDLQGHTCSHRPCQPKLIERTDSGKHYRMPPRLAAYLGVEVVDLPGAHPTEPPTVLSTVSSVIVGLETYIQNEAPINVIDGLKQALIARPRLPL